MKGGKWGLPALAVLLAVGGALPQSREPEGRRLITALAVDGESPVAVTGVTAVRVTEEEEPETLSGEGKSLAEACRELRGSSARRAYLGQTEQLLLGEGGDLEKTLDFIRDDRELRLDTLLYIVRGDAGEALAASAEKVAAETGGQDPRGKTAGEVLARLAQGEDALVPALAPGEDGVLVPAGWAVLGPQGVKGYLEGEAALGAGLLSGTEKGRVVTLPGGAVELSSARHWAREGTLRCTLTARAVEGTPQAEELEAWGEKTLAAALAPGWDCWGLDREQGALEPWNWETRAGTSCAQLKVDVRGRLVEK